MSNDTERTLTEVLPELNQLQLKYVVARVTCRFDKDAADQIGIHSSTVAKWKIDGIPVDEAVRLLTMNSLLSAKTTLEAYAQLAADELVREVSLHGSENVRAALAILDRIGLPPTQRNELTGKDGGPIETIVLKPVRADVDNGN